MAILLLRVRLTLMRRKKVAQDALTESLLIEVTSAT